MVRFIDQLWTPVTDMSAPCEAAAISRVSQNTKRAAYAAGCWLRWRESFKLEDAARWGVPSLARLHSLHPYQMSRVLDKHTLSVLCVGDVSALNWLFERPGVREALMERVAADETLDIHMFDCAGVNVRMINLVESIGFARREKCMYKASCADDVQLAECALELAPDGSKDDLIRDALVNGGISLLHWGRGRATLDTARARECWLASYGARCSAEVLRIT